MGGHADVIDPETLARRFVEAKAELDGCEPGAAWSLVGDAELIEVFRSMGPLFASVVHECCVTAAVHGDDWTVGPWHPGSEAAPYRIVTDSDGNEVLAVFGDEDHSASVAARVLAAVSQRQRTTQEWCDHLGVRILDDDGWRDGSAPKADEPIARGEFDRRVARSTAAWPHPPQP